VTTSHVPIVRRGGGRISALIFATRGRLTLHHGKNVEDDGGNAS